MARRKSKENKKRGKVALKTKIVGVALVPLLIMGIVIGVVSTYNMKKALKEEMITGLHVEAVAVEAAYSAINDGAYINDGNGNLMKGDYNITANEDVIDSLVEGTDTDITLFLGDTRMATTLLDHKTGERIIGTKADEAIVDAVVNKGEIVERFNVKINGDTYYACYVPLKNPDGSIVGMSFAGKSSKEANAYIVKKTSVIIGAEIIIILLTIVLIVLMSNGIQKGIRAAEKAVSGLSNGDLTTDLESRVIRRNDELGDMAKGVAILLQQLREVVQNIRKSSETLLQSGTELSEMATQTSSTADEISRAVEDISRGAVAQSEEIEAASSEIDAMGQLIEKIVDNVAELSSGTLEIKGASDHSIEIIQELSVSNDRSMEAVQRISEQVNATNDSAMKISSAVDLITSIAEETNLLSLNASIEAARAGEQGRGFAVVAGQIQKLAEQSNDSARTIADIINNLLQDSENTVRVMNEVQGIMNEQQAKLNETRSQFEVVGQGIDAANMAAGTIKEQTETCDVARAKVVDVISNLSAISEENAASTEETTASMQELNATINLLAESAGHLQGLSKTLEENISFFHVGENNLFGLKKEELEE